MILSVTTYLLTYCSWTSGMRGVTPAAKCGTSCALPRSRVVRSRHATAAPLAAHPNRLCCFARTGHTMADAHVFWQLDGSLRVMVYTLVAAHVGALVCSATTTNPSRLSPPIDPTPTGGRYSGACRSARGRRPMQRRRDDRRLGGAVHASQGSLWRTRPVTHGRSRVVLAMATACLRLGVCRVSPVQSPSLRRYISATASRSEMARSSAVVCARRMDPQHLADAGD